MAADPWGGGCAAVMRRWADQLEPGNGVAVLENDATAAGMPPARQSAIHSLVTAAMLSKNRLQTMVQLHVMRAAISKFNISPIAAH